VVSGIVFVHSAASSSPDWVEMTAIATAVLAFGLVFTAVGVFVTYRAAKDELRGTQAQIEAAHRPLLIDVTPNAPAPEDLDMPGAVELRFPNGHQASVDTRKIYVAFDGGLAFFAVPLRNVGPGLAVIDSGAITANGDGLSLQPLGREVQRERVPSKEMTRVLCTHEYASDGDGHKDSVYELRIPYADLDEVQKFTAIVRLERVEEQQWRVQAIQQTGPSGAAAHLSRSAANGQPARSE
jgi:hypothetical protein